ncbi:MAG TPA: hypothetical protein VMY34_08195, partial [Acidimicrobiales bacterium]|nr:hypothetical protein [Acidimicrobiales bacterium]
DRLYYHLDLLERHGLVRATEERGAERRYEIVAQQIIVDPALTMPQRVIDDLVSTIFHRVQEGFLAASRRAQRTGVRRQMLGVHRVVVTEAEREELANRLDALVREYEDRDVEGREVFEAVLGLWPSTDDDEEAGADEEA